MLTLKPTSFADNSEDVVVQPDGVPQYLTYIIASSLDWVEDQAERDQIWEMASHCLAQRSGRTAMGDIVRTFNIPMISGSVDIELNEPGLTGDDLGHKTWSSSYELAKILPRLRVPSSNFDVCPRGGANALELGSGTGLFGLAAAALWSTNVLLTDLEEIVPNLRRNVDGNTTVIIEHKGQASSAVLDWRKPEQIVVNGNSLDRSSGFPLVLAADPIYSSDHPALLATTVCHWLARTGDARFFLAYPVRTAYAPQIAELHRLLAVNELSLTEVRHAEGQDDWQASVTHQIEMYMWSSMKGTSKRAS